MFIKIGHLVVIYDGVAEGGAWRGVWSIERPGELRPTTRVEFVHVDDGETDDLYATREEAAHASMAIAKTRAEELYNER